MKNNKKYLKIHLKVFLLILCILFVENNINLNQEKLNHEKETGKEENIITTPNPPLDSAVTIMNDLDLYAYPGMGFFEDPFIIEDLIIDGGGSGTGIFIMDTTLYFVIRNCTVFSAYNGISINNIGSGTASIYNNTIYNMDGYSSVDLTGLGMVITNCSYLTIYDNHIYDCKGSTGGNPSLNGIGIVLNSSDNCHVTQNTIHQMRIGGASWASANGISITDSDYNLIEENEIYDISNFGSSSSWGTSGNGVHIYHGNYNILLNNTIHSTVGSDGEYVGNGIFVDATLQADSNQIINNRIYNNIGGNGHISGNGIVISAFGGSNRVKETQIIDNLIYNNTGNTILGSIGTGSGIYLLQVEDTVITGNTILNCSGNYFSGWGIGGNNIYTSTISGNTIDNCFGTGTSRWGGIGICILYSDDNIITDNVISNSKGTTGDYEGNGIMLQASSYNTISMNLIVNSSHSGVSDYSGWGIYFRAYCDYNDLISNTVSAIDGRGILFTSKHDNNRVMYNNLGSAEIQSKGDPATSDSSYNEYIGNTASVINVYSGSNYLIEDNTVNQIVCNDSYDNVIVGNYNSSGGAPIFNYTNGALESNQYFLKITSPEAGKTYRGAGGIELEYKYQFKGYELSWLRYTLGGDTDQCPRPDGTIYIPWKSGSTTVALSANDTTGSGYTYNSKEVIFTYIDTSSSVLLIIIKNEGLGSDPQALDYHSSSGSGTALDPYIIKNKVITIPLDLPAAPTAGISIQNTDAYFILKDSIVVGGLGSYGITLKNVKNAQFDNVSIIGLPHTYVPGSISDNSAPIERGFYLDSNCNNNTIMNCNIFRTSSYGIIVEGDNNYINNTRIANAYKYGINITGDSNMVRYNEIATFGGPDYNNSYYIQGDANNLLSGIVIGGSGSNNLIEQNTIRMYPEYGIEIDGILNQNNIIIENQFDRCTTNITDSGTETHFLKINTPLDGDVFTGSTPLTAFGYYSGTEGFQDIEDGIFPSDWSLSGNGTIYDSKVIDEKIDKDGLNHKKILYTYTGEGVSPEINVTRDFGQNIVSGTIEFWVLRNGDNDGTADFTFLGPTGILFSIMLESGNFYFQDNLTLNDTTVIFEDDCWYRLSIDFSDDGSYAGLGAHQYKFRIYNSSGDGLLYESINADYSTNDNCSGIRITAQGGSSSNMTIYSDAFGYSWHSGYEIGDNMYEGMFISPAIQLGYQDWTWMGYSLNSDNAIELPSFGDVIIPLPNTLGEQTLQLFANFSLDYQTFSPIIHFTYYFDRKINILSHYENEELVAENTIIKGGLAKLEPVYDLNITITYNTEKLGINTYTNASIYYRINQGSWMGPFVSGSNLGTHKFIYILDKNNYALGDTVDYYLKFQQYEVSGKFLQQYFWTQEGLYYFESEAQAHPFHKKVSPVPYQLTLIYSVFYEAERTEEIETDLDGYTITMTGMAPVAMGNFSVDYYNITTSMKEFNAIFDSHVGGLNHKMYEENSTIYEPASSLITGQDGVMSPFIIPNDLVLIVSVTNISIPVMLFQSNIPSLDNNLVFTGDILDFTYNGIKYDWFYGTKGLKEFEIDTGNIHATIRYDALTGIMVYYNYNDFTVNESKSIYFGLYDNNQSYSINLNIEKREELYDTSQDFVNVTLEGILYDPPGDHSYTQMSAGTSITTGWSLEKQFGTDIQEEMRFLVFGVGVEIVDYEFNTEGEVYEFEMTHTYQQSLTSSIDSDDPDLIGPGGGDLYYGVGTYIIYKFYVNNYYFAVNESDPANYKYNDIRVFTFGSRIEYTFTPNTSFSVLGAYLDDLDMSELEDENIFEDNQITGTEGSYIHELQNSPLFWTPSSVQEFGYSSSASEMKGFHSYMEFSKGTYFVWDQYMEFSVGGEIGLIAKATWSLTTKIFETTGKLATLNTWSEDFLKFETVTTEDQILVHLEDDDGSPIGQHDQFKIKMYNDTRYNSIGFIIDTEATYTSGPHEYFTGDRRPPTVCEFVGLDDYLHGAITLRVIAIDEEINGGEENNIFKVNFYLDDDPNFGTDSIFLGVHGDPDKTSSDDPELFKIIWDSSLLNGKYYLFAEAWDYGYPISNSFLSDPVEIQIDNVDPEKCELFIDEPYYGAINFYSKVSDIGSGISYVEYWDGDPDSKGSDRLGTSDDASSSYNFVWVCDPNDEDAGKHKIYAKAFDKAGNSLISKGVEIIVQTEGENEISNIVSAENIPIIVLVGIIAGACVIYALLRLRSSNPKSRSKLRDTRKLNKILQDCRNQTFDPKPDNIGKKIENRKEIDK